MKKIFFFVSLSLILFLAVGNCFAFDDASWEYWSTTAISGKINEQWKVQIAEEYKFGDDFKEYYYHHTDLGFVYACKKWLSLSVNYRQIFNKDGKIWEEENRPHINGTVKWEALGLKFSDRSRLELRLRPDKDDTLRYRNKLTLKADREGIQPYLANEIFIDFDRGDLYRDRIYLGLKNKLWGFAQSDFAYFWQNTKSSGSWSDIHGLYTNLKFAF